MTTNLLIARARVIETDGRTALRETYLQTLRQSARRISCSFLLFPPMARRGDVRFTAISATFVQSAAGVCTRHCIIANT